ncbi:MAG: flavodoxin family protein [Oscillospiraceae bacterium]|nr:flavodoxin family protein [Oscillospiraceae bacterium]
MRIIIVNGSPRASGATGQILSRIRGTIQKMDANMEIEYIDLAKIHMNFCTGCASCYSSGVCPVNDELEKLSQNIETCNGVVLGSPTYASNVSGQFKILIDRGHFVFEQLLKNKACFSVVTYENYGGKKAMGIMNDLIRKSGGAVSAKCLMKLNHGDMALNAHRNKQIEKQCHRFLRRVFQKNPLSPYERLMSYIVFNAGIKPHVFKNESRYKGLMAKWAAKGLFS